MLIVPCKDRFGVEGTNAVRRRVSEARGFWHDRQRDCVPDPSCQPMAAKPKADAAPKRLNRTVDIAEALKGALDPAMRKRGFASRDILTHWAAMAPKPYDTVTVPDRLTWPRGERGADGATLYLRCAPGHALALQHEGPLIARSVNRYFGYLLVANCRISTEPFSARSEQKPEPLPLPDTARQEVGAAVEAVEDDGVREALRALGHALHTRRKA
ncbi:MAG: DUF721 domain-containing protein [Hyphomicrobiales bacterium]|nr:MAG: DUF721 domain-containing protein [Hyphomicrobiales bacterium]